MTAGWWVVMAAGGGICFAAAFVFWCCARVGAMAEERQRQAMAAAKAAPAVPAFAPKTPTARALAWDRLERENAELRRALRPFAELADKPLAFAAVEYGLSDDPERQVFHSLQMQRAFNCAAEVYRAHFAAAGVPKVQGHG